MKSRKEILRIGFSILILIALDLLIRLNWDLNARLDVLELVTSLRKRMQIYKHHRNDLKNENDNV